MLKEFMLFGTPTAGRAITNISPMAHIKRILLESGWRHLTYYTGSLFYFLRGIMGTWGVIFISNSFQFLLLFLSNGD